MIGPMGLGFVKDEVKKHLLTIYPELKSVKYQKSRNIHEFINEQEKKFGNFLPVTKLGKKMPKNYSNMVEDPVRNLKKISHGLK